MISDLLWWRIRAPTADEIQAAAEKPPKRLKKRKGTAASAASASASASAAPVNHQPHHLLEMHFIQLKVGKLKYDLPGSSLTVALRFAGDHSRFDTLQCGQMTAVGQDVAWNAALSAAVGAQPAAPGPAHTHTKQYALEAHFHLVTSKRVSGSTRQLLADAAIGLVPAVDYSFWGPRVTQFCTAPGPAQAPGPTFSLFQ